MAKKKFYIIFRSGELWCHGGFFSNLLHVISHLIIAEKKGLIPVVDMKNYPTPYNEKIPVRGSQNSWDYYFQPVSPYTLDEVYKSDAYVMCDGVYQDWMFSVLNSGHFEAVTDIINRYIHIHSDIWNMIVQAIKQIEPWSGHILGVHFRGWSMAVAPNHPMPPSFDQIKFYIYYLLAIYPIKKIFLSTEQSEYVDKLKEEFGDMLMYNANYFRTPQNVNAYTMNPAPRELHFYRLGLNVLLDAVLLSRADYLLAGGHPGFGNLAMGSNVSLFAQIMNNKHFKDMVLIRNGIVPPK